ncbi:MAG: hypothetical protein HY710_16865 [Candidatus Latescibacteria bacterium]|nr:hypothetical protein [Candidatus Latescibacterota bacterium]
MAHTLRRLLLVLVALQIPVRIAAQQLAPPSPASLGTITASMEALPLADAMQVFALKIGVNILIQPGLEDKKISAQLGELPVLEAFEAILRANGFWYEVNPTGNVYLIKQADVSFSGRVTERIPILFGEPRPLEEVVKKGTAGSGSYFIDERTNSFIVTDTPARIADIRQVITALDVPAPQVLIEVEIASIDRTANRQLGISWDFLGQIDADSPVGSAIGTSMFDNKEGKFKLTFGKFVSSVGQKDLRVTLEALERNGLVDILASPRLMTVNRRAASIKIIDNIAVGTRISQSASGLGQSITEPIYKDVGVTLDVTPYVAGDSLVVMDITPTVSSAQKSPFFPALAVDTQQRTAQTRVMAKNNQTIVIGGLLQTNKTSQVTRVPLLGHIPLLGYFFRQSTSDIRKSEVIVFITPRIITTTNIDSLRKPPEPEKKE